MGVRTVRPHPRGQAALALLRDRPFPTYMIPRLVSSCGDALMLTAAVWVVTDLTGHAFSGGTVLMLRYGPAIVFAPLGGWLVDRYHSRKLQLVTQALQLVIAATLCQRTLAHALTVE